MSRGSAEQRILDEIEAGSARACYLVRGELVLAEAVAGHLKRLGYDTGIDLDILAEAAGMARAMRGERAEHA